MADANSFGGTFSVPGIRTDAFGASAGHANTFGVHRDRGGLGQVEWHQKPGDNELKTDLAKWLKASVSDEMRDWIEDQTS